MHPSWPVEKFCEVWNQEVNEMISYNLDWIALLSKWEYEMSTKPCNLDQTTLIQLMNKSHEGFMLSKCQKNASMDQKGQFKVYRDAALTKVK